MIRIAFARCRCEAIVAHFSAGIIKEWRFVKFHFSLIGGLFVRECQVCESVRSINRRNSLCFTYIRATKSHSPNQSNQLVFFRRLSRCVLRIEKRKKKKRGTQFLVRIAHLKRNCFCSEIIKWAVSHIVRYFFRSFVCLSISFSLSLMYCVREFL